MDPDRTSPSKLPTLIIGLIIGLLIAGGIWFLVREDNQNKSETESTSQVLSLNIDSPKESVATDNETIMVSGNTGIDSVVTIIGPSETKIVKTEEQKFSTQITLVEGKNTIDITVYEPGSGSSKHEVREILYLNEDLTSI